MDQVALKEVAEAIVREQFLLQWPIYALMVAIAIVVGTASAFVGAYAKRRGEALATKADFNALLTQLKATTSVAEEVRLQLSHADWAARELRTLRRIKLEELMHAVHEVQAWVERDRDARMYGATPEPGAYPMPRVEVIAGLYFPELTRLIHDYGQVHRELMSELLRAHSALLDAGQNVEAHGQVLQEFAQRWQPMYQRHLRAISALEVQAREVMVGLVGA